jgi:hypothetical protein
MINVALEKLDCGRLKMRLWYWYDASQIKRYYW